MIRAFSSAFEVAPLQVILDLVRPKLGAGEQFGDSAPPKHGQTLLR